MTCEFGDTIYVDTGSLQPHHQYRHCRTTDSGVTIQGPTGAGHTGLLNRGNTDSGSFVFELNNADAVTLSNLSITGAYDGINLSQRLVAVHA